MDTKSNYSKSSQATYGTGKTTISSSISSSRPKKTKKHTITIPNPEDRGLSELRIVIPSRTDCKSPKKPNKQKVFCGKQESPIPQGFSRRGTTYECLKKGFGAGMCSIYKD